VGGKQRRYILNVPTNYDNKTPYRLIVTYHQLDGNDKQMFNWKYYGLLPLSKDTTIFVAPNGQKNGSPCTGTGDGDSGCGWPNSSDSDLALADAVVAQIEENFCIDTNRILATGWSYGGSMSFRTACSRPLGGSSSWGVRAIAIYAAAQLSGNCTPSKPVAYYHAHGTRDGVLNYENMGLPLAQAFAKANSCTWATPAKVTSGAHKCTNLAGCATGYPLEFCSFDGDHTPFPDNGQAQGSWGPEEAWKFLSQF
jgi:poly(3-hydroxybutyrate) depolymerase